LLEKKLFCQNCSGKHQENRKRCTWGTMGWSRATKAGRLGSIPGVKWNFWPLRIFWPIIACQFLSLFCFSE